MSSPRAALTQSLAQKTILSQQLRQSVELLQLSGPELQSEIQAQLSANPLLALDDEGTGSPGDAVETHEAASAASETSTPARAPDTGVVREFREPSYLNWRTTASSEDEEFDPYGTLSATESLTEHLLKQLGCLRLPPEQRQRCEWIIGNLNDDGFLPDSFEELAQDCARTCGQPCGDLHAWRQALQLVQGLDPAGIAAEGPTQSLILQVSRSDAPAAVCEAARKLLTEMPAALARRDYRNAAKTLGSSPELVQQAHALILSLNPHPGAEFSDMRASGCILAEILLVKSEQHWQAVLNPSVVTTLRFDEETYALLTQSKLKGEDLSQWKNRARDARGFVRALEMRYSTITAVAQAIVEMQSAFFTQGPKALKPMGLKDIAQRLNLSESTVSRAASGKYLQTPSGTFELKFFFTSALAGQEGETTSSAAARRLIVEAVAGENPAKPLSDAALAEILAARGIHLARRTVAKYREIEQIPPKSLRKRA